MRHFNLCVIVSALASVLVSCSVPTKSDVPRKFNEEDIGLNNGSLFHILRDNENGCQYIVYNATGVAITPRMNRDGKQICK
jgi:hypothetical protein